MIPKMGPVGRPSSGLISRLSGNVKNVQQNRFTTMDMMDPMA